MDIKGKLALVTGASSGIGAVAAKVLAQHGADVILVARREAALQEVAKDIEAMGQKAHICPMDLGEPEAIKVGVSHIKEHIGIPDILVNNAGSGQWKATYTTSPEELVFMTKLPYFAAYMLTQAFLKEMLDRNSGHIVNITSGAAMLYIPGSSAYSVARWAVRNFTACLQADLRGTNVNASLLMAAKVGDTEYFQVNEGSEERIPGIAKYYRTLTSQEVADGIVRAITKNIPMLIMPFMLKLTYWLQPFMPKTVQWLVERDSWKYKV